MNKRIVAPGYLRFTLFSQLCKITLMGLSHERIFRRITRRVDRFSIRSHMLKDFRFFPLKIHIVPVTF